MVLSRFRANREDHPAPESVVKTALLVVHRQTRVQQLPFFKPLLGHGPKQGIPAVRGITQAEAGDGPLGQAPAAEIIQPLLPRWGVELGVEVPGSLLVQGQEASSLSAAGLVHALFGELHPRPFGQQTGRVQKRQVFQLHDKGEHAAALAAAKTVVYLLVSGNRERGGLFRMEGAKSP